MNSAISIQQASKADTSDIAEFLSQSPYIHRHLDWQGILDWLNFEPFLLLKSENRLFGLLTCPPDADHIAWIRCFACAANSNPASIWNILFTELLQYPGLSNSVIYSVGLNNWFSELLLNSGFVNFQNIVILDWDHHMPHLSPINPQIMIRPMEIYDLQDVALLDKLAFEPMWVNSADKIMLAYDQSEHASVAEVDGKIIGYELSTANHFSAHLARIAVHPQFQKHHIGAHMISEMFKYFTQRGIHQITVNTQDDNLSSLSLYKRVGFFLTGERFPVYRYIMNP